MLNAIVKLGVTLGLIAIWCVISGNVKLTDRSAFIKFIWGLSLGSAIMFTIGYILPIIGIY